MNKPKTFIFAALALASVGVTSGVEAQQQPAQQAAPQLPQAPNTRGRDVMNSTTALAHRGLINFARVAGLKVRPRAWMQITIPASTDSMGKKPTN
jgi:hypothetical protein